MFAIPGVLGLIVLTFLRPQASIAGLDGVPLIQIVYLMAAVGFVVDLRTRALKPRMSPLAWHAIAYHLWLIGTLAIARRDAVGGALSGMASVLSLFFIVAATVQSFRALRAVATVLALIGVFLSVVGIHQGILEDPNELTMCISVGLPLLLGLYQLRPRAGRLVLLVVGGAAISWCLVYTKSRGGQFALLAAIAVFLVRRFGWRGAAGVAVLAAPVALFGSHAGSEAEVTVHNSYALAMAETGIAGLTLFVSVLYQSMRGFVTALRRYSLTGPSRSAFIWAGALMSAQAGLMTGAFFLSFHYTPFLWTFMGVCSGFQLACKRHDPEIDFVLKWRDWRNIAVIVGTLTAFLWSARR